MVRHRVLVVEDDPAYQEVYAGFFRAHAGEFLHILAETGGRAFKILEHHPSPPVDAVLLDWTLPDMDGLKLLHLVRSLPPTRFVPVLMITAHQAEEDREIGFSAGADDYLIKPFSENELLSRLRAILRRRQWGLEEHAAFEVEDLRFDLASRRITVAGRPVDLTPTELGLLLIFLRRPNMIHSQEYLWEAVWGYDSSHWKETLKKHISNLRKKLGPKWGDRIETCEGQGYILGFSVLVSRI